MQKIKFKTNYQKSNDKGVIFEKESRTKQSFKEECDINTIMARYRKNGILPEMIKNQPSYGDFSQSSDYLEAMQIVAFANEQFAALDAKTRNRFNNDPAEFLKFTEDPESKAEMVKMGLATIKTPPKPDETLETLKEISNELKKKL